MLNYIQFTKCFCPYRNILKFEVKKMNKLFVAVFVVAIGASYGLFLDSVSCFVLMWKRRIWSELYLCGDLQLGQTLLMLLPVSGSMLLDYINCYIFLFVAT